MVDNIKSILIEFNETSIPNVYVKLSYVDNEPSESNIVVDNNKLLFIVKEAVITHLYMLLKGSKKEEYIAQLLINKVANTEELINSQENSSSIEEEITNILTIADSKSSTLDTFIEAYFNLSQLIKRIKSKN